MDEYTLNKDGHTKYFNHCVSCQSHKSRDETFFPQHEGSSWCESGKRPHCSCDMCF